MPVGLDMPYRVFISEDPIGLAGGINQFSYVKNRPTRYIDPLGLNGVQGMIGEILMAAGGALVIIPDPPQAKIAGVVLFGVGLVLWATDEKENIDKQAEKTQEYVDSMNKMKKDMEKDMEELEKNPYQKKKDCP